VIAQAVMSAKVKHAATVAVVDRVGMCSGVSNGRQNTRTAMIASLLDANTTPW